MYHSRSPSARRARKQVNALRCCAFTLVRGWVAGQSRARAVARSLHSGAEEAGCQSQGTLLAPTDRTACRTVEIGLLSCAVRAEVPGVGVPPAAPNWTGANELAIEEDEPAPATRERGIKYNAPTTAILLF
jgi:hypothetical protein